MNEDIEVKYTAEEIVVKYAHEWGIGIVPHIITVHKRNAPDAFCKALGKEDDTGLSLRQKHGAAAIFVANGDGTYEVYKMGAPFPHLRVKENITEEQKQAMETEIHLHFKELANKRAYRVVNFIVSKTQESEASAKYYNNILKDIKASIGEG